MEYSKKIYKKDSKGKIRVLHIYADKGVLIQLSGVLGSDKQVKHESYCESKNIGKSNQTTPTQQAVLEANAKIETKMSTGYFETIEEAENSIVILPMLAKDYKKEFKKVNFPCFVQPKLDGMRALYNKGKFISRKGKDIDTMGHIVDDIMFSTSQWLDGELYAHGKSFQENMKLIKKYREGESEKVQFHVYDIISDEPFDVRYPTLRNIVEHYDTVKLVPTHMVQDEEGLKKFHTKFISEGYEGTIVRHSNAGYGINKRDSQLLKYKDFIDEVYEVVDVVPSDKNPNQGVIHCTIGGGYTNVTFGCGMRFSHKEREEILTNRYDYIGQMAEIRFFEYTDDGLPRFPVCVGFRNDK
jgi:DNA ligase-1